MATLTLPMFHRSCAAQSYASPRPGPLTGRCAKLMELVFALSKSWDLRPLPIQRQNPHNLQHHNGSNNGQPLLRDQLCILIRQHNLDATLVKAYAADFCGTATLSGASRELVESFIYHLSAAAKDNRDGLICKLNSYAQPQAANQ
jgi:hypothetical protein